MTEVALLHEQLALAVHSRLQLVADVCEHLAVVVGEELHVHRQVHAQEKLLLRAAITTFALHEDTTNCHLFIFLHPSEFELIRLLLLAFPAQDFLLTWFILSL